MLKRLLVGMLVFLGAFASKVEAKDFVIGLTVDDLRLERWQRDRDIFTAEANKLGVKVISISANGDSDKQMRDTENLIASCSLCISRN